MVDDDREAEERKTPRVAVVYGAILREGQEELRRKTSALVASGIQAGLVMSFSLLASAALRSHLPEADWRTLLVGLGYPVGFILVVLGRMQLFTENTLTAVLPVLDRRSPYGIAGLLRLWTVVLVANLAGAGLAAWFFARSGTLSAEILDGARQVALDALGKTGWTALLKGIVGGWLIALMVWILPAAEGARLWAIALATYLIALTGSTHIIAGSAETLFAVCGGHAPLVDYLAFAVPTLAGNVAGGVLLVTLMNHGQVVPDENA